MFKLLFAAIFISSHGFAASLLVSRHVVSGFVQPEHSFVKDCKIYRDGSVATSIVTGHGTPINQVRHVSHRKIFSIKIFLEAARYGRIVEAGAACDAGTFLLDGYLGGQKILLDENHDCGSHKINRARTVPSLKRWSQQMCGF